jgi:thiamine transport system ATP-binding protein
MLEIENLVLRVGAFELTANLPPMGAGIYAIMGPSGAGKSTLLAALGGFLMPVSGRICWHGKDITRAAPHERPMAQLFQDNNLFPHLSIFRNVALALHHKTRLSDAERAHVMTALARVGLQGLEDRKPAALSGGQQSRAALARVLLQKKPVVLVDEPFAALGPALKNEMLDLLATLAEEQGQVVLMVTHDPEDANRIAEQTIVVANGMVSPPVSTHDLFEHPPKHLAEYLGIR